ncbi:serine/threonine protein kinase, partial [Fischerella thermalis CCMEE 5196]
MESYVPNLTSCLTNQRLASKTKITNKLTDAYLPPVARTASAIREWQAKLKTRKSIEQRNIYISN